MRLLLIHIVLSSLLCAEARAQDKGEVIVVPPVDTRGGTVDDLVSPEEAHADAKAVDEAGFVSRVRVGERGGETEGLAEVLADVVGAHVRQLGGLGGFSSLSVRGAPAGHTAVLVDGVPLARLGSASADLGRFEPGSFSEIALHRGAPPAGASTASALELVTAVGPAPGGRPLLLSAGAGSFGARHLRGRWVDGDEERGTGLHLALGWAAADGDFRFFDDNGTPLNRSDDSTERRRNNGYDQIDAAARGALAPGAWDVRGGARWLWKRQGVPGGATVQSERTSLTTWSQILDVAGARDRAFGRPELTARAAAYLLAELQRYRDPDGEIGLAAQDRRYLTLGGGASAGLDADVGARQRVSGDLELRAERFSDTDLAADDARTSGRRWGVAGTLSDHVALGRVEIVPALRVELERTRPTADFSAGMPGATDRSIRSELQATPRVAALAHLTDDLSLKAGAGRFVRSPTALELYGDRGFIVGNPDLRPETGVSGDLGVVVAPARALGLIDRVYAEAAAFTSRSRDTIVLVPTAALAAGAQNLGTAIVWGGELVASARAVRAVTATAHYTLMRSRQEDTLPSYEDKELPQRPRHQLYARVDLAARAWERLGVLFADASVTSGNHLDPASLQEVPRRTLLGAGVKVELAPGLLAALEGKNLADQRVEQIELDPPPSPDLTSAPRAVSDFFGYPLPGRAFYATLQWEH